MYKIYKTDLGYEIEMTYSLLWGARHCFKCTGLSLLDWPSWKQLYLQRMKATLTFHVDIYDQANMMKFFLQRYRIRTEQSTQLYM